MRKRDARAETRGRRARSALLMWSGAAIAACVSVSVPIEPQRYHRTAAVEGADELMGADECAACHDEVQGYAPIATNHADCESCHGPGNVHADSEEITDIRYPASVECLGCHEAGRANNLSWSTGEHERAGVICSDCHNPHNREPRNLRRVKRLNFPNADASSQLCISCHEEIASQLDLPSHHPVQEGMIGCPDCHAPHGDRRIALGSGTALCSSCHQDYAGPWIFEHLPAAESCTDCHAPHGAVSYNLLDTSQPTLCLSCHSTPDIWHLRAGEGDPIGPGTSISTAVSEAFYTRCTDCHGAIHGSYEDPFLRR
jgi:DmsE family decaheme c-type cytochrome